MNPALESDNTDFDNNFISISFKIIGLGLIFTAVNLGLFFDQIVMPQILLELFQYNDKLTGSFQNFLLAIFLTSKIAFLIIVGTISDHLKSKIGSRLPLILSGLIIMAVSYFLVLFAIEFSNFSIILIILYIMIGLGSALLTIPGYALVVDLFKIDERGWAGIGIALFGAFGTFFGIILESIFNDFLTKMIIWLSLIFILFMIPVFSLIPKKNLTNYSDKTLKQDILNTPGYLFNLQQYHGTNQFIFINLLLIQVFWGASVYIITINTPLLLILLQNNSYAVLEPSIALIILGVFGILLAGPIGLLIKKIGKTRAGMIGAVTFAVGSFLLAQSIFWSEVGILVILFIIGGSTVIISVITIALPADLVPISHAGQYMGIFTMASMLLSPVVGFASSFVIDSVSNAFFGFQLIFNSQVLIQILVLFLLFSLHKQESLANNHNN